MRRVLLALAVLLLPMVAACTSEPPPMQRLVIAGGEEGDVYAALADGLAAASRDRWRIEAEVMRTTGASDNVGLVASGRADIGFATIDTVDQGLSGEPPFSGAQVVVALAGLYDDYVQVVVRADGPVQSLANLTGRRLATGPVGSVTDAMADRLLSHAGVRPAPARVVLSPLAAADALEAGTIDAFLVAGGLPTPAVADLAKRIGIRLLSLGPEAATVQGRFGERYRARTVPEATYGLGTESTTLGVRTVLIARPDLPEPAAFALTGLLFAAKDRLVAAHTEARRFDERTALDTGPVPLHPGASRYYREAKPFV